MDIEAPNIKTMIIAVKIFGAADGFLPNADILAKPADAIIIAGPKIHSAKINIIITSRLIGIQMY